MSSNANDTKTRILEATWHLMEDSPGREISMNAIAKAAGISRQAVYLHFASRTELLIATLDYVDNVKGLDARMEQLCQMTDGLELLDACVETWGNYIPEIIGMAKTLLKAQETDLAMANAWHAKMGCLREMCKKIVETLNQEWQLSSRWTPEEAIEIFFMTISINNWMHLVEELGWSQAQYINGMKRLLRSTLVKL